MKKPDAMTCQAAEQASAMRADALDRRTLLKGAGLTLGGSLLGLSQATLAQDNAAGASDAPDGLTPPEHAPTTEYVFSILATIGDALTVGDTASGQIRAIPITGGEVEGEGISGHVVPGGADWQRTRADGVTEIEATYAIELADATLIKVINRGLISRPTADAPAYFRTVIHFDAPTGPWNWLNEALFLCKAGLHPDRERTVLVEVFKLV